MKVIMRAATEERVSNAGGITYVCAWSDPPGFALLADSRTPVHLMAVFYLSLLLV